MKRIYRVPIMGKVIDDSPLKGGEDDPLRPIPLLDIAREQEIEGIVSYESLNYNPDEEWCEIEVEASDTAHKWLLDLIPQLGEIVKTKGWKLDKTELIKIRQAKA